MLEPLLKKRNNLLQEYNEKKLEYERISDEFLKVEEIFAEYVENSELYIPFKSITDFQGTKVTQIALVTKGHFFDNTKIKSLRFPVATQIDEESISYMIESMKDIGYIIIGFFDICYKEDVVKETTLKHLKFKKGV